MSSPRRAGPSSSGPTGTPPPVRRIFSLSLPAAGGSLGLARPDGSVRRSGQLRRASRSTSPPPREPDGSGNSVTRVERLARRTPTRPESGNRSRRRLPAIRRRWSPPRAMSAIGCSAMTCSRSSTCRSPTPTSPRCAPRPTTWVQATLIFRGALLRSRRREPQGDVVVSARSTKSLAFRVRSTSSSRRAASWAQGVPAQQHGQRPVDDARAAGLLDRAPDRRRPASRCNHSWVTMNGARSVFTPPSRSPKEQMMAHSFRDADRPLYTIHYADFRPAYLSGFELQDGTNDTYVDRRGDGRLTHAARRRRHRRRRTVRQRAPVRPLLGADGRSPATGAAGPMRPIREPVGAERRHLRRSDHAQLYFIPRGDQRRLLDGRLRLHHARSNRSWPRSAPRIAVVLSGTSARS